MASIGAFGKDNFLSHVVRVRSEIRDKFLRAHRVLQDRETDLLAKLQELKYEFTTGNGISRNISDLIDTRNALLSALEGIENKELLQKSTAHIDIDIEMLERKFQNAQNSYKNVILEWDEELEGKLSLTGDILLNAQMQKRVRDYKKIEMPVLTFGKHSWYVSSPPPGVFFYPKGIAIDHVTNFLYVCDSKNHRIQVFNAYFEFVFLFTEKMDVPVGICIKHNKVYVTQYRTRDIFNVYSTDGKYLRSVGGQGKSTLEFDEPRGLDISTKMNRIYIAEYGNNRVHCLNLDFTFHSIIDEILGAKDVKLTTEEIVIL